MLMKLVKGILWIVVPFFAVAVAFAVSTLAGFITFAVVLAIMLFVLRAQIFTLIGQMIFETDHGKAFKWFERALKSEKMKPESTLLYAYLLLRDGILDKSEEMINKILFLKKKDLKPNTIMTAKLNRALIKWKKGNIEDAIEEADEIYAAGYRTSVFYGAYGYLYILNKQYTRALEINKEAYEYSPDDNIIMDNYAQNLMLTGDMFEAENIYKKLLAKNPTFIEPYYNYGMLLKNSGQNEKALEYFQKALSYPEKFLSTVTHKEIKNAINEINEIGDTKEETEFDIEKFSDVGADATADFRFEIDDASSISDFAESDDETL